MNATASTLTKLDPLRPLTAHDRCDRCGAQAYVRATLLSGGELLFCGHHYAQHEANIFPLLQEVLDETKRLRSIPGPV